MPTPTAAVTLVFVHGFLDDAEVWRAVTSALSASAKSLAVDLAGMSGDPDAGGPFTLERYVADVGAIVDEVDGPVVLVGQSMGAQIAELVAADRGGQIDGLVLVTPVPLAGTRLPAESTAHFIALGGQEQAQREARRELSVAFRNPSWIGWPEAVRPSPRKPSSRSWRHGTAATPRER